MRMVSPLEAKHDFFHTDNTAQIPCKGIVFKRIEVYEVRPCALRETLPQLGD
jgi:hypothetical protein